MKSTQNKIFFLWALGKSSIVYEYHNDREVNSATDYEENNQNDHEN